MAKMGRRRSADVERPHCPMPGHGRRDILLNGIRRDKNGEATHQRYICSPGHAERHTFIVKLADPSSAPPVRRRAKPTNNPASPAPAAVAEPASAPEPEPQADTGAEPKKRARPLRALAPRPYTPPEPCPEHPGSTVIRYGSQKYGADGTKRQRYQCRPVGWYPKATRKNDPEHAIHVFQPHLPRRHVGHDEHCAHCQQLLTHNAGAQAVGRKHQASASQAAEALRDLAGGATYGEVGQNLQEQLRREGKSAKPKNAWRRAADMLEVFEPVLWEDWVAQLSDQPPAVPQAGVPRVVVVDDLPIFGHIDGNKRSTQRFAALALGEALHDPNSTKSRKVRLRLLQAFPVRDTDAYTLLLDGLGYVPDFVIGDGGKGIAPAVKRLAERTGHNIVFVMSAYHIGLQLNRAINKAQKHQPALQLGDLRAKVQNYSLLRDETAWRKWWEDYERRLAAHNVPRSGYPDRWKRDYFDAVVAQLRALAPFPDIPLSTGALETLIGGDIKATLARRGAGFGNLVRTNQLTELLCLGANGYFTDMARVAEVLRADAMNGDPDHPGFVPPVRQILDHGTERSLLDRARIEALARLVEQR